MHIYNEKGQKKKKGWHRAKQTKITKLVELCF